MRNYSIGNVIQITDEKHAWFPCLLIISEVKQWGVVAYAAIPKSNDGSELPARAYNRLTYGTFTLVGDAAFVAMDETS